MELHTTPRAYNAMPSAFSATVGGARATTDSDVDATSGSCSSSDSDTPGRSSSSPSPLTASMPPISMVTADTTARSAIVALLLVAPPARRTVTRARRVEKASYRPFAVSASME